jgi:hypothetical protein
MERPFGGYFLLLGTYLSLVGTGVAVVRRRQLTLPERPAPADLALVAVATYRASRLLSKDSVTAVVRAPFTSFEEATGAGEVNERVDRPGVRHAVGELLTCPFCLGMWIATVFTFGLLIFPRVTRWAMGTLSAYSVSDVLNVGWDHIK